LKVILIKLKKLVQFCFSHIVPLSIFSFIVVGYFWIRYELSDIVMTSIITETDSPDHLWKARVQETIYEGMIVTIIDATVQLISAHDPSKVVDILSEDTGGHEYERPRISWASANTLKVTVFTMLQTSIERRDYGGVHIDIVADPAGEEAYAAWRKNLEDEEKTGQDGARTK
jgi:hypothetical protein